MLNVTGKRCRTKRVAKNDERLEEPYASRLKNALQFHDLESAEASLRNLDAAWQGYREASDRTGVSIIRALVLKGKRRALGLASNPRVSPVKRRQKQEIARWFTVWLQTPDLFFDWLEVRKRSEEYNRLFVSADCTDYAESTN
jgi:hypothetical protein